METIFMLLLLANMAVGKWDFSATARQCPVISSVDVERHAAKPSGCLILDCNNNPVFLKSTASMATPDSVPSHSERQKLAW